MPPKKKGGKGGKKEDEDFWAAKEAAAALAANDSQDSPAADSSSRSTKNSAFSAFSSLGDALPDANGAADDGEGDLMAAIRAQGNKRKPKKKAVEVEEDLDDNTFASKAPEPVSIDDFDDEPVKPKKGKKGKKAAKADVDDDLLEAAEAPTADEAADVDAKAPQAVSAEDLWAEEEVKPKKGKKDKKKSKAKDVDEDEFPPAAETPPSAAPATAAEPTHEVAAVEPDADADEPSGGVLSKKEKEKLKKEKEKAKKKAQAAAKKATTGGGDEASEAAPAEAAPIAEPAPVDGEEGDDAEEGGAASKDKKKKKKKAAAKEEKPAADAGKPKKVNARIAALQAQLEAQKAAEEEFKRQQEEARRKEEEEERRLEEEAKAAEEARRLKKEKEKAKRDQLKKEGKLLTPAQKREQQIAEARRQALIASGVTIAGLQGDAAPAPKEKRNFSRKPGRQQQKPAATAAEPVEETKASEPEPVVEAAPAPEAAAAEASDDDDVKDAWDAESDKEDVKDAWDAESEEEAPKPAPKAAAKPVEKAATPAPAATKAVNGASKPAAASASAPAKLATNGKAPAKAPAAAEEESSSEEEEDDSSEESDSEDDSDDDSDEDSSDDEPRQSATAARAAAIKAEQAKKRQERIQQAQAAKSKDDLRSPICCILGHVDTGKTKLLDKIRQTNVQEGEAGGITQQIGATYFPMENIRKKTAVLGDRDLAEYKLPGLLVIDTPGHESFTNLRSRGSSLCNIAVLVIDIMHGLEPQTIESIKLLREKKTPFIVALNKIDRLYDWQATKDDGFQNTFERQKAHVQREFKDRCDKAILALAEQGLNARLYFENTNFARYVSVVPTSAHTGEGVPDMLMLLIKLTQERMSDRLMYISELECTVLEVKVIEGLGTTLDVVLSNGILHEGDEIVVCSLNGAIVTNIRALLTPQPLKELRIKGQYVHHKMIKAAMGIKIVAPGLENAIAGSRLLVRHPDDDLDELKAEVFADLTSLLDSVDRSGLGVWVQASTLGSLEALLDFLKSSKIPVAGINIGPVHKKDVVRAGVMLERAPEFAVMLCFDVEVDKEAEALAKEVGIRVFKADIIYHLFDNFTAYREEILEAKRKEAANTAVWPCRLKILKPFATRDPIILGCDILQGQLRVGTPLCAVKYDADKKKSIVKLGRVSSIELNHKSIDKVAKKDVGAGVAVKIEHAVHEPAKAFGRHFDEKDELYSLISRPSIQLLKDIYRSEVSMEEWNLIKALKPLLDVPDR